MLDDSGNPLVGIESAKRFSTFEEGPCPVLEAFALEFLVEVQNTSPMCRRKSDEPINPSLRGIHPRSV